jgi:hypothetical protein
MANQVQNMIEDLEKAVEIRIKEKVNYISKGKDNIVSDTDDEVDLKLDGEHQDIAQAVKKNNRVIIKQVNGKIPKVSK